MKIAVDFQSVEGQKTGIGVAAANLLQAVVVEAPDIQFLLYSSGSARDLNTPRRILWESVRIPLKALRDKPDLLYSPGFAPALIAPRPQMVTVHDLIGMVYPENLPPAARFYWSYWLPLCVRRARVIVASSESTRRDIARLLKVDPALIKVVPLAASDTFYKLREESLTQKIKERRLEGPYFITVGTLEPRKNIPNLLRAFKIFKDAHGERARLVLVGKPGGQKRVIEKLIHELGLDESVRLLGYVANEDLNLLYNAALGYVFISSYEGFGLPVLEAMSCGLSGVLSNVSSLPEVAGGTAVYTNPFNVKEIAEKMGLFYKNKDLRERLSEAALSRASQFSWKKSAQMMIEIFRGAL